VTLNFDDIGEFVSIFFLINHYFLSKYIKVIKVSKTQSR